MGHFFMDIQKVAKTMDHDLHIKNNLPNIIIMIKSYHAGISSRRRQYTPAISLSRWGNGRLDKDILKYLL